MPKTIATTPSWYWPEGLSRVIGVPPYSIIELGVDRWINSDQIALRGQGVNYTYKEVRDLVEKVKCYINSAASENGKVAIVIGATPQGAILALGAVESNCNVYLYPKNEAYKANQINPSLVLTDDLGSLGSGFDAGKVVSLDEIVGNESQSSEDGLINIGKLRFPHICFSGKFGDAWHSNRSLLASGLSFAAFFSQSEGSGWLSTYSPGTWQGFTSLVSALYSKSVYTLSDTQDHFVENFKDPSLGWLILPIESAESHILSLGRKGRPSTFKTAVIGVEGVFSPDLRREISGFVGQALTLYGMAESGPMLASHPTWFLDEATGIPLPNMNLNPADPDTNEIIDALWEFLDQAMILAYSPSLAIPQSDSSNYVGNHLVTGALAASDPNGMLYILDEV